MENQKGAYEEKALEVIQRATEEKREALSQAETLEMLLQAARVEAAQWQGLCEEMKESSEQLKKKQEISSEQVLQLQNQLELARGQEAGLREELGAVQRVEEELQFNIVLLEEQNQNLRDQIHEMRDARADTQEVSLDESLAQLDVSLEQSEEEETLAQLERTLAQLDVSLEQSEEEEEEEETLAQLEWTLAQLDVSLEQSEEETLAQLDVSLEQEEEEETLAKLERTLAQLDVSLEQEEEEELIVSSQQKQLSWGDGDQVLEQLRHALDRLQLKERECEELQNDLEAVEAECQSCQVRLTQCRDELRQRSHRRSSRVCSKPCVSWIWLCVLLPLLLSMVAVAILWAWHPPFKDQVQDLYSAVEEHIEDYLMQAASPQHVGCFRPV
ncbi:golgin subfamily A member 6-like protein 4 [Oncorhynchus kisutch]|uniref:golgin subfamily A member 6-like protein 4 n=1 Tax=Oncorhynchus kisutch TaxID=8019 RepID=UPI00099F6733|nr:golgin subfamily A member 6-like protein 4 [Oncorhynchus kisutch]